jgi:hypothetical protein
MEFRGFKGYAIINEGNDEFYSAELDDWTDEFDGGCFFPTYEMAFEHIKNSGYLNCEVYHVEIPQPEQTFEYYPVNLPCDTKED